MPIFPGLAAGPRSAEAGGAGLAAGVGAGVAGAAGGVLGVVVGPGVASVTLPVTRGAAVLGALLLPLDAVLLVDEPLVCATT
jgi:hypothetical protein